MNGSNVKINVVVVGTHVKFAEIQTIFAFYVTWTNKNTHTHATHNPKFQIPLQYFHEISGGVCICANFAFEFDDYVNATNAIRFRARFDYHLHLTEVNTTQVISIEWADDVRI